MRTYDSYYGRSTDSPAYSTGGIARVINNTQTDNLNWGIQEVNQSIRYLVTKYYFNERSYTVPGGTIAQTQFYNLPPLVKKVINVTITIGGVKWQPIEATNRTQWDRLNVINFYQDFPSHFFIFNGQLGIFPIPATAGNAITINYKTRIPDLSIADVTDTTSLQTMALTNGSTTITASGTTTTFNKWMESNAWIRVPYSTTDSKSGDNQWYQISTITSGTQAVLANTYGGATISGASFTIGNVSILPEDYQDLPLYRMAAIYYTTRFPDPGKVQMYEQLWENGVKALDEEFGSKTTSVALPDVEAPLVNPNLFQRSVSQT